MPPHCSVDAVYYDKDKAAGENIGVGFRFRNTGDVAGWCEVWTDYRTETESYPVARDTQYLQPDQWYLTAHSWVMPPVKIQMHCLALQYDDATQLWSVGSSWQGPWISPHSLEWAPIQVPSWLSDFLESGWLNLRKGDWASIAGIDLPPFTFEPGHYAHQAIQTVADGANWLLNKAKEIWDKATDAFWTAYDALGKIDDWLGIAATWFLNQLTEATQANTSLFWNAVKGFIHQLYMTAVEVKDLVDTQVQRLWDAIPGSDELLTLVPDFLEKTEPFATIISLWSTVYDFVLDFGGELIDFISDPFGYLEEKVDGYLSAKVE